MDAEWDVYHVLLQHKDNFIEFGEDEMGGPYKKAYRGRTVHAAHNASGRAGSVGVDSRQVTSRVQRKRQMWDDELEKRIHLEKLKELEQAVTTEELHCRQRRYHQQKDVVPARSKDEYMQEVATPWGGDDMAD